MDDYPAREQRGDPYSASVLLASTTGVTLAAIEIAASVASNYIVVDQIYMSCDSIPTKGDFDLIFVGQKNFTVAYDELGADGMVPIWSWMNFLDPNPATNTKAWWVTKDGLGGPFVMEPSGDSISIKGRNAGASDNYVGTGAVALTVTVIGRQILADDYY